MHIVELVNYEIVPTQECFLIRPLRQLFNADRTKNKEKFMQQLSVVYFMADPRSSYSYITDDKIRLKMIIEQEGLPEDFKIDAKLQEAMDNYRKHTVTTSTLLLEDARLAADKVRLFLKDIDLKETDKNGKPKYTVNMVTAALKQVPQVAKDLRETEKIVEREVAEEGKARGGYEKTVYEDEL